MKPTTKRKASAPLPESSSSDVVPKLRNAVHKWLFTSRIRPNAFSWKSSAAAVRRVKEAVSEITNVARRDPTQAAEGAIRLIERLSPALEHVDSSSGSLGGAVNRAIEALVPIIAGAPVTDAIRKKWLERLFAAHEADEIPYIETLTDHWGDLCLNKELASAWADRLIGITQMALSPDKSLRGHYHGITACLDALLRAARYPEIYDILSVEQFWSYKRWAVKALIAEGRAEEAIALAESSRGPWTSDGDVNRLCEGVLLSVGRTEEAYQRYGLIAHRAGTYLATFRAVAKTYPSISRERILADLVEGSPGEEGKWFATAKELSMYDFALQLVQRSPCDPKTLTRAAYQFAEREPGFAYGAGFAALYWLCLGHGYEITSTDVWGAFYSTVRAAKQMGKAEAAKMTIRKLVADSRADGFVRQVLGRELGLP